MTVVAFPAVRSRRDPLREAQAALAEAALILAGPPSQEAAVAVAGRLALACEALLDERLGQGEIA